MKKTALIYLLAFFLTGALTSQIISCGGSSGGGTPATTMTLTSSDVTSGSTIGATYIYNASGCTGSNESPQLSWTNVPDAALSLVITCLDSSASNFVHWILYNIPTTVTSLDRAAAAPAGATNALNDYGGTGYDGPCPPTGENHTYEFKVWALNVADLETVSGFNPLDPSSIVTAIDASDIDSASFTGTFTGP